MPRLAAIHFTKRHQLFQKEEGAISAVLSDLEGRHAWRGRRGRQPAAASSPFATTGREGGETQVGRGTRVASHMGDSLCHRLTDGAVLSVSTILYRRMTGAWRNLGTWRRTISAPVNRSGEQTNPGTSAAAQNNKAVRVDNPPDAAYPVYSGDVAATPDQRSSMARDDTAAAVEIQSARANACVYECKMTTRKYKCMMEKLSRS